MLGLVYEEFPAEQLQDDATVKAIHSAISAKFHEGVVYHLISDIFGRGAMVLVNPLEDIGNRAIWTQPSSLEEGGQVTRLYVLTRHVPANDCVGSEASLRWTSGKSSSCAERGDHARLEEPLHASDRNLRVRGNVPGLTLPDLRLFHMTEDLVLGGPGRAEYPSTHFSLFELLQQYQEGEEVTTPPERRHLNKWGGEE